MVEQNIPYIKIETVSQTLEIIPAYVRSENWSAEFQTVKTFISENDFINSIEIGDMNVRLGKLQVGGSEEAIGIGILRNSKYCEVNRKGKDFIEMCEDFGLVILNGSIKGDEDGNYTFVNGVGSSVNDIAAISFDI